MGSIQKISAKMLVEQREGELSHSQRISKAIDLQTQIDALTAELKPIKDYYVDLFKKMNIDKTSHEIVSENGSVKITETNNYSIDNDFIPQLKQIFKEDVFDAYITTKVSYSPSKLYKEKLSDGDYTHKDVIREACKIAQYHGVKFTPITKVTHEKAKPKAAKLIKVKPEPKAVENSLI